MSNHGKSGTGSGADTEQVGVDVIVPADESTILEVDGLKYVERKNWKYRTKNEVQVPVGEHYAIWFHMSNASGRVPRSSFITLKVDAEDPEGSPPDSPRRVREIEIQKGYAWDGASGPTIDTSASFKASLVHDALYQCMRLGYVTQDSRGEVDRLFRHMLGGMGPLRRGLWYWAVRGFGKRSATPKPHRRRIPAAIAALLGIFWLVHWAFSKLCPAQTADLLDRFSEFLGMTWVNWLGALLESGLVLLGILATVYFVVELVGWTLRPWGRKQTGRKHPGIVAWAAGIGVIESLVHWLTGMWPKCSLAQPGAFGEVMALLGAGMLVGLGIELWKGDS